MANPTIADIENFFSSDKFLDGLHPDWGEGYLGTQQFRWNIVDTLGVSLQSHLVVSLKPSLDRPTVALIVRGHPVYRFDVVPATEEKLNPPWAAALNLPNYVRGTHSHPWYANKDHIAQKWDKTLPCREPVEQKLTELEHVIAYVAHELNITMNSEQRVVYLPEQGRFFN
ncbi:hypothetical protein [Neptunicoccus sediminis]|uniref:hypothetical protein n=1 Tax=Neptunicoccus sediminis TaxID=1892596 RepID=UPI000845DC92|nr:hypothetical protein [Neptunicoccus sediminis]